MRDERIGDEPASEDMDDWAVLGTLLNAGDEWPWSIADLVNALDRDDVLVMEAINRLGRGGLIHRINDELIYPTRTAIYCERIIEKI